MNIECVTFGKLKEDLGRGVIARMMNSVKGLNREQNALFVRKAEHCLKLKFNISPFSFWLSSCPESVASCYKMGDNSIL